LWTFRTAPQKIISIRICGLFGQHKKEKTNKRKFSKKRKAKKINVKSQSEFGIFRIARQQ